MTTTVTVDLEEDELTAAAEMLGTSSPEETLRKLVANAAARAANVARKRAEIAEREAADQANPPVTGVSAQIARCGGQRR